VTVAAELRWERSLLPCVVVAGRVVEAEFRFVALCAAARFAGAACFLSGAGLVFFGPKPVAVEPLAAVPLVVFAPSVFALKGFEPAGFASGAGLASGFAVDGGVTASPLAVSAVSFPEAISSTTWLS